jgi:hypothetical protein
VVTVKTRGFVVKALEVRINDKNLNVFMNGICKYQICCSQRNCLFVCEVLVAGPLRGLCLEGGGGGGGWVRLNLPEFTKRTVLT